MRPVDDGRCFACGPDNPIGLHLAFEPLRDGVVTRVVLRDEFQGWRSIAHGGIAMTLLDEAMSHAAAHRGHRGLTAKVNVRFRKAIPLGEPLVVEGRVAWQRRNVLGIDARISDVKGTLLAHGDGQFVSRGAIADVADRRNPG